MKLAKICKVNSPVYIEFPQFSAITANEKTTKKS